MACNDPRNRAALASQDGSSLIEVMAVAGAGTIVALALGAMTVNMHKNANGVKFRLDADTVTEEVRTLLSSDVACRNSFGGQTVTGSSSVTFANLRDATTSPDANGSPVFVTGNDYGDRSIVLNSLVLNNFVASGPAGTATMTLNLNYDSKKDSTGTPGVRRTIAISLKLNSANVITSCSATAKMSDGIWQRATTNLDNISFNPQAGGGWVGIGTANPRAPVDIRSLQSGGGYVTVSGAAYYYNTYNDGTNWRQLTDGYSGVTYIDQGTGKFHFSNSPASQVADAVNTPPVRMTIDTNGFVGIGTLTPTSKLAVVGSDSAANGVGASIQIGNASAGGDSWYIRSGATGSAWGAGNLGFSNSTLTPLVIGGGGNVGIGTSTPSYTLHVVGTAGLSTGTAWTLASDAHLKDIHGDYEHGLDEILRLHTVRFTYKKDNPLGLPSGRPMTGFIAQEVAKIIPEAVKESENGYLEINVDPIHWAVVNAIQELYGKILSLFSGQERQTRELAALTAKNEKLEQEVSQLKNRLENLESLLQSK